MRTLFLSDLHLGNGGFFDIFAGGNSLADLMEWVGPGPTRVVLNGDILDLLLDEEELDGPLLPRSLRQVEACLGHAPTHGALQSLFDVTRRGGEVIVLTGNHDLELGLTEVQHFLINNLMPGDTNAHANVHFHTPDSPVILSVGGLNILAAHGEHDDPRNKVDHHSLRSPEFRHPAGSWLVKKILNPLKTRYGLRFLDTLKPDFRGAVLAALAVKPAAVGEVFKGSSLDVAALLFRGAIRPPTLARPPRPVHGPSNMALERVGNLCLDELIDAAGLTQNERAIVRAACSPIRLSPVLGSSQPAQQYFGWEKLLKAGLSGYAAFHRSIAGAAGEAFFDLEPSQAEVKEAERLAGKYAADVVILGHTHAARWYSCPSLTYVNSGTWIGLLALPGADEPISAWSELLANLRADCLEPTQPPGLKRSTRLTAVVVDPIPGGGARLTLIEWDSTRGATELGATSLVGRR